MRRLARREMGATFGLKRGVILPKKGLQELKKLLRRRAAAGRSGTRAHADRSVGAPGGRSPARRRARSAELTAPDGAR